VSDGVLPRITSQRVWLARSLALIAIALAEWNREKTLDSPIQVTVQPPHSPVVTGDTIRVSIRLADAGAGGAYQLAVRGLAEEWYTLEQPSVVLGPGEWATVSLAIRPPAALGRHTGSYTVTIEARAGDGAQGSAAFPLSVAPLQGIGLDITQVQATGATMALEASIVNAQEWDTMVGVVVSGPPEITARVDPAGYCLAPRGGTRRFVVHVGAAGARAGAGAYDLTVSAMVQGLSVAPSVTRRVRFEYRPYVVQRVLHPFVALAARRGFARASIAALLALGLSLVAADTGVFRPSSPITAIVPFTTSPPPTVIGAAPVSSVSAPLAGLAGGPPPRIVRFQAHVNALGTAVMSWSVRDALMVRLDGTSVPAIGEQTLDLAGPLTVTLQANGDGGTVIRRLRLAVPLPHGGAAARQIAIPLPRDSAVHHAGTNQTTIAPSRVTATLTPSGTATIVRRVIPATAPSTHPARGVYHVSPSSRRDVARATASPRPFGKITAASTHAQRRVKPQANRASRRLPANARDAISEATTVSSQTNPTPQASTPPTAHRQTLGARATGAAQPHASRVSASTLPLPHTTPRPTNQLERAPAARRHTNVPSASPTARALSYSYRAPTPLPAAAPVARASTATPPVPTRLIQPRGLVASAHRPTPTVTPFTAALTQPAEARPTVINTALPTATHVITDARAIPTASGRPTPSQTPSDIGAPRTPIRATTTATGTPRPTATNTPRPITPNPRPTTTHVPRPTDTPPPADTPRPTATNTPRPTMTSTPRPTDTLPPTNTPTATPTNTPTATPTDIPTATPTTSPTAPPTTTPTDSPTATPTDSPTASPTATPTATSTPTPRCNKHDKCHPK